MIPGRADLFVQIFKSERRPKMHHDKCRHVLSRKAATFRWRNIDVYRKVWVLKTARPLGYNSRHFNSDVSVVEIANCDDLYDGFRSRWRTQRCSGGRRGTTQCWLNPSRYYYGIALYSVR